MAKDVCQYKFNLLPEHFQDHIMGLEQSWRKMNDAKFLNVVKEFKRADKKKCSNGKKKKSALQKKKCKESKGDDGDDGDDGNHAQKSKRQSHKKSRRDGSKNHKDSSGSKQCFCYLFKATGAPEFAYGTHNTNQCCKKAEYERKVNNSARLESLKSIKNDLRNLEKKFSKEIKLVKKAKSSQSGNASNSGNESHSSDGTTNIDY